MASQRGRAIVIAVLIATGVGATTETAQAIAPTTTRVSVTATGQEINGYNALPAVSQDGRWVAFDSYSDAVTPGDANGVRDVFLRDTQTGAVRLISQKPDGTDADGPSAGPTMSADGRYIAFISDATNLAPGTNLNFDDVYLYDRVANTLRRVSTSLTGNDGVNASREPRMASDGRYLSFESDANDLVTGDVRRKDIFIADTTTLALRRVSGKPDGTNANGASYASDVSDGGRFVSFSSFASDIVGGDIAGFPDVFVKDMSTGVITRQSVSATGGEGNSTSERSDITADGCYIAFYSTAANLVTGSGAGLKAMVRNRCTPNTEVASLDNAGAVQVIVDRPVSISDDGCAVVFVRGGQTALAAPNDRGVILRDRCQGLTSRIDISTAGDLGNRGVDYVQLSAGAGRYVAFDSGANNLVPGDLLGQFDAFVRDRANAVPPVADLKVSSANLRATADGTASRDPDNRIASATIAFGDGTPDQAGLNAIHDYARAGTYTVTLVVNDGDGLTSIKSQNITVAPGTTNAPPGPGPGPGPTIRRKLRLTGGVLSATRFKVVKPRGSFGRGRGTQLLLGVSEAARLDVRLQRPLRGRRSKGRCSTRARAGRRCTLWRVVGTLVISGRTGDNFIRVSGRVKGKALPAGSYRLVVTAKTKDGRRSGALTRSFRVIEG